MSIAIMSDLHLGDGSCRLTENNEFNPNGIYQNFKNRIMQFTGNNPLKYLVLNGDIMDFSISPFHRSIRISQPFFRQLSIDKITENVIYIPGNHDKYVWDGLQWDTSVIGNLNNGRAPDPFVRIQPAIIDLPDSAKILLEGISTNKDGNFGDIFLKGLFDINQPNPTIILAYPNLYIKKVDETILITHGHMFESAWVMLSELLRGVSGIPNEISLKDIEEWNAPLTSLICTGVGSGGLVSELFYKIEREAYEKRSNTLLTTLDGVLPRIKKMLDMSWFLKILLPDKLIKQVVSSIATKSEDPKKYENYFDDDAKVERFKQFYTATRKELERLNLREPKKIIFGHTHHPYDKNHPYKSERLPDFEFYNTGGWLKESYAEVFLIDDSRFDSFRI